MNLGESNAVVESIEPGEAGTINVAARFEDGRIETAALRPDLVPDGLAAGDAIGVTKAALYRRWTIRKL